MGASRRTLSPLLILFWASLLIGCRASGSQIAKSTKHFPRGTGFVVHEIRFDGKPRPVWVFIPKNYQRTNSYPTIVFLHGLFEAGNGNDSCLSAGLGPVIAKSPEDWPFITVFPQSNGTWRGEDRQRLVIAGLDAVEEKLSVDRDRVILAGLSYGGLGVWEIGANNLDRFSALVPIASPRAIELAPRLSVLPVWAFNFRADLVIPSSGAEQMCRQIIAHGGSARQTKFAGIGHDCWDLAVAESNLVDWMLTQRRDIARVYTPPSAVAPVADVR